MTKSRKDYVRFPGEVSAFGEGEGIRTGGLIDEEVPDVRAKEYQGIVSAHQAIGSMENWHIDIQDEQRRVRSETIYSLDRKKKLGTSDFVSLDDRFWSSLDGKPIMCLEEALDSAHGLTVNTFDFSEPELTEKEEEEEEQELEMKPDIDLSPEISEWINERYGKKQEPEKEIPVFRIHPQIERKKISFNLKLHCLWALKHKKPPQKRKISWRRARHKHQLIFQNA